MRFGTREYRITLIAITVVLAFPILIHIFNGLNSRMLADDYCFAANVQGKGLTGAMNYYYYNWQGTFSSTAVQSTIALTGGSLVRWLPLILIIGWWLGLIYLLWQLCVLLNFQSPRLSGLALATLVLYAILEGTPTVFQSLYWTSGSVTYTVPMVLFTIWGGLILQVSRAKLSLITVSIIAIVFGLCAGMMAGFSPIFAVFEIGLLGLLLIGVWYWRPQQFRTSNILLFISLIGAAIGMVIMVIAPGNSVRQAFFEKPPTLLPLIGINLTNSMFFVGMDLAQVSLMPHIILLVVSGWLISSGIGENSSLYRLVKRGSRKWLLIALAIAFLMLFGVFLPTSYNISGFPPGRALIIPHVIMIALVMTWGGVMALSLKKTSKRIERISIGTLGIITVLLLIGPVLAAAKSLTLSPKLQSFSAEWDARDTLIRQTKIAGNDSVSVLPFTVDLADYAYIAANEQGFIECMEDYYHIQKIIVQE